MGILLASLAFLWLTGPLNRHCPCLLNINFHELPLHRPRARKNKSVRSK